MFVGESFHEGISCTIHGGKAATIGSPMDTRPVTLTVWSNTSRRTQKPSRSQRIGPNVVANVPVMGLDKWTLEAELSNSIGDPIQLEILKPVQGL